MRSSKKNRTKQENGSAKFDLSSNQYIDLLNTGADVIKSGLDWLNEIEKTKQIAIEANARIMESNNRLSSELVQFEKDILKIQREFELEYKKLDDKHILKMRQLDLIEKIIDKIDKIEIEIKVYQKVDGLTSSIVMTLFEQLHQQKLAYMNNLVTLGQR
ncbi:hypothetical protein [Desulfomicrobium baculatum]|uniref:Uncharacterized protein n=1 Tax=Desulfomicrobium baculatum (strain DSM 4028 / VKM B-1378 / X) TaxID=525897 RepID=C7LS08_DESBD|nr:hypothetical protein [Desulfomicrobium baculatum]ACU89391.1 hypothetical protein Dbac_1292 [Desulfomicrobium baculatum DSM 4028]